MSAHAEAHAGHPPVAHQSSRVDAPTLGMLLFIASEVMLFGSFFTAYFFVRVVNDIAWPPPEFHLPVFVAGVDGLEYAWVYAVPSSEPRVRAPVPTNNDSSEKEDQ